MTNSQIIYNAALAHGFTEDQLSQLLDAYKGDLPFHTFQEWKSRGYSVKKGEHALFTADLWKYTTKPSKPYALYNATKCVCLWAPAFAAYLAKKRSEGKHYNVALSHSAKKLVRLIFALEKSRQPYCPAA